MQWLRLYTEVRHDRKLRRLSPSQRWLWIVMLTIARESPKPGELLLSENVPVTNEDLADEAAISLEEVEQGIETFKKQNMVSENNGVYCLNNWDKRQFTSDNSTERVKRYRDRQAQGNCNDDETLQKRYSNDNETPPDSESDSDSESEKHNPPKSPLSGGGSSNSDKPQQIMDHYNTVFEGLWKRPLKLTKDRQRKIQARLTKFSVHDICLAINNIRGSPFHCGENDKGQVYATPEFICRNDGQVDKWMNFKPQKGVESCGSSSKQDREYLQKPQGKYMRAVQGGGT